MIASTRVDTADHPIPDQFERWRCAVVGFEVTRPEAEVGAPFRAKIEAWSVGEIAVVVNDIADRQRFVPHESPAQPHNYSLILVLEGTIELSCEGQSQVVSRGQIVVFDWCRHVVADLSPARILMVIIPQRTLRSEMAILPDLHCVRIDGVAGRILTDYLLKMTRELASAEAGDAPLLSAVTTKVLAACLAALPASPPLVSVPLSAVRRRVERCIETRIGSQALSAAVIANDLAVSKATLYRAFAESGGVSGFLQTRRLEAAHAALRDKDDGRSVKAISAAFGFGSAAHFSNAFRARFGYRPGEARNEPSGLAITATIDPGASAEAELRAIVARLSYRAEARRR